MNYTKIIFNALSTLVKFLEDFLPLKKAILPTNLVYIIHLMFHFIKHSYQAKLKFHFNYKSNR